MTNFDFGTPPDYSGEHYPPGGLGDSLHFVSRFLVTFLPQGERKVLNLIALTHYTHFQHSMLAEEYCISAQMQPNEVLYGFWAGFNHGGNLKVCSSGSESLNIRGNKELDEAFLSDSKVLEKLKLVMPHIKALGSLTFRRY